MQNELEKNYVELGRADKGTVASLVNWWNSLGGESAEVRWEAFLPLAFDMFIDLVL